jgi:hypothetical protein
MNLLSVNFKSISRRRHSHLLLAPIFVVSAISLPLWANSASSIYSNLLSMASGASGSLPMLAAPLIGADGFALFAEAQKSTWQVQTDTTSSTGQLNPVVPSDRGNHLVGAGDDPAFGQANEVGMLPDYGYEIARNISRLVTFATLIITALVFGLRLRARKAKGKLTKGMIVKAALYSSFLTASVHMIGTFIINNCGGLGRCCGM